MIPFIDFFTDPILRAPMWGSILMCIASSLMGVLIFLRKRSLLGESLSHAAYPGAVLGVFLMAMWFPKFDDWAFAAVLGGAFISSLLGLKVIEWMEKANVRTDAALCFILALFFGSGVLATSILQAHYPVWLSQVRMVMLGQAATMHDLHIVIYGLLALVISLFLIFAFRPIQATLFDRGFAESVGIPAPFLDRAIFWLLLLSLIVGIRSVGIVLMSSMVIAPAVAARQFSDKLTKLLFLAALFGALSGMLGNFLSVAGSTHFSLSFPTGPLIVLVSTVFALLSLLFAPKRGLIFRTARVWGFRLRCLEENILKTIWKKQSLSYAELKGMHQISLWVLRLALWRLIKEGWIVKKEGSCTLSVDGQKRATSIVRLHRLWELYLTEMLGVQREKVHRTAEEMEHILTPEMEAKLTQLLGSPKQDPHNQPIPERQQL